MAAAAGHLELLQLLIAAGSGKVASKHDDEVRLQFAACMHACTRVRRLRHQATAQGWALPTGQGGGLRVFAPAPDQLTDTPASASAILLQQHLINLCKADNW
jgi:hypothetical protein